MTNSAKLSELQDSRTVLLSIKPKYAEMILSGKKTVEFRRVWASEKVDSIIIYASSPIQMLVGSVSVREVSKDRPNRLWEHCKRCGGGLSKRELASYFDGKPLGVAVLLENVQRFKKSIDPKVVIENFSAPQSFRYIKSSELTSLQKALRKAR